MTSWNKLYTDLIRNERKTYWGNWTLIPTLSPGAIGILDVNTGNFSYLDTLTSPSVRDDATSEVWAVGSEHVSQQQANVALEGTFIDPETGTKITAGVDFTWSFQDKQGLISKFSVRSEKSLQNVMETLQAQWSRLAALAKANGLGDGTHIYQGFCVVTEVMYADSGLNVGAESEKSTFDLVGTVKGMEGMVGGQGKGSWLYSKQSAGFSAHLWPQEPNQLPTGLAPIAFTVTSFNNDLIIPNWTKHLNELDLYVSNKHGGTYAVDANVKYTIPGSTQRQEKEKTVTGGMDYTFALPLDATDVHLKIKFDRAMEKKEKTYDLRWLNPVMEWTPSGSGHHTVDLYGVYPGDPSYKENA